jgi:hypothetical protein
MDGTGNQGIKSEGQGQMEGHPVIDGPTGINRREWIRAAVGSSVGLALDGLIDLPTVRAATQQLKLANVIAIRAVAPAPLFAGGPSSANTFPIGNEPLSDASTHPWLPTRVKANLGAGQSSQSAINRLLSMPESASVAKERVSFSILHQSIAGQGLIIRDRHAQGFQSPSIFSREGLGSPFGSGTSRCCRSSSHGYDLNSR